MDIPKLTVCPTTGAQMTLDRIKTSFGYVRNPKKWNDIYLAYKIQRVENGT